MGFYEWDIETKIFVVGAAVGIGTIHLSRVFFAVYSEDESRTWTGQIARWSVRRLSGLVSRFRAKPLVIRSAASERR